MSFHVSFYSCVFSPFSIAITSFGEERANLSAFRTFVRFVLVWICRFPLPLGVWEGRGLWLWHSLDFSLTFLFYSTDRCKAMVPVLVLLCVALWFILRGELLYVLPCAILFLCFAVLLALRLPRLGKRELILVLFVCLIDLCLFGFVGFLFLLMSGKGCGVWLWHSLDFSLTFFTKLEAED